MDRAAPIKRKLTKAQTQSEAKRDEDLARLFELSTAKYYDRQLTVAKVAEMNMLNKKIGPAWKVGTDPLDLALASWKAAAAAEKDRKSIYAWPQKRVYDGEDD